MLRTIRILAAATYGDVTRRPLYSILLFTFSFAIVGSKFLTLFSFYQEINMVREMGMATITFWGFIIVAICSGLVVTQELEDRTAVTLLSKPIQRSDFLLGRFAGLVLSLVPGVIVLTGVLFLTLWFMVHPRLPIYDSDVSLNLKEGISPFATVWRAT
jgi:ABC-type transport system involved in multi-copper enzyme maturation permease subunit